MLERDIFLAVCKRRRALRRELQDLAVKVDELTRKVVELRTELLATIEAIELAGGVHRHQSDS
jgi:hypothetical protein